VPKKLKGLLIDRVDLVTAGDNPDARVSLFKHKDPEGGEHVDTIISKALKGLEEILNKWKGGSEDMPFDIKKFLEGLPEEQRKPLEKELNKVSAMEKDLAEKDTSIKTLTERVEELEKTQKPGDGTDDGNGAGDDDVLKGLPEAVRKMVEDSQKRAEEAEKIAKQVQDEALTREYVTKAQAFTNLTMDVEKVGPVLKRIASASAEDYAEVEAILKAANELVSKNTLIMKELGSGSSDAGGDAWAKIEAQAQELVTKSADGLTKEQAILKVLRDNPDLYTEYQKELGEVQ